MRNTPPGSVTTSTCSLFNHPGSVETRTQLEGTRPRRLYGYRLGRVGLQGLERAVTCRKMAQMSVDMFALHVGTSRIGDGCVGRDIFQLMKQKLISPKFISKGTKRDPTAEDWHRFDAITPFVKIGGISHHGVLEKNFLKKLARARPALIKATVFEVAMSHLYFAPSTLHHIELCIGGARDVVSQVGFIHSIPSRLHILKALDLQLIGQTPEINATLASDFS